VSDCDRDRAAILRLLADVASGGWEDEDGHEMSTDAAREAIAVLKQSWCDGGESARTQSDRPRGRRARGRAQVLRLLADVASGGWEDEDGREISTDAAREAIAVLRQLWCAR